MDVGSNATFRHSDDDRVALRLSDSQHPRQVQMTAGTIRITIMAQYLYAAIPQRLIVISYQLPPSCQQSGITLHLHQTDSSHDIRHVAFVIGSDDVILPPAELCFRQSIFALSMQRHQLKLFIKPLVRYTRNRPPSQRPSLRSREILDGMKREAGKIRDFTAHLSLPGSPESMGSIRQYDNSAESFLQNTLRSKQGPLVLDHREYLCIITRNTGKVHRNDYFSPLGDGFRKTVIIHLVSIPYCIDKHYPRPYVTHDAGRCGISVCRSNNFITRLDAQNPQNQFHTCRSRVQAHGPARTAKRSYLSLQLFRTRPRCNPSGTQGLRHLNYLLLSDVRR